MKDPEKKISGWGVLRLLFWAGLLLYGFSRFIPSTAVSDYPVYNAIDNAWSQCLHIAFAGHWQFGRDIVFTYGPWGFLARGYSPPTYLVSVMVWIILTLIFMGAGWRLARQLSANRLVAGLWLAGFMALASVPVGNDFDTRLVAWGVLLLFCHFFAEPGSRSPIQYLLIVSLGWLSLVKFTGLMESALLISVIAVEVVFRRRQFPWIVPLWLASLLFFWVAAGQHLSSIGPFLGDCWRITNGYTEAMMLTTATGANHVLVFILMAALIIALLGVLAWERHRLWGALPVAGSAAILFLAFKLGYVRNDVHEVTAALALVLISLASLVIAWPQRKTIAGAALGLLVVALIFASVVFNGLLAESGLARQLAGTFNYYNLMAPVAAVSTSFLENNYENLQAAERKIVPLPDLEGGTDLYSYDQSVLFAHNLRYQPRPVIQSYSAYTPALAEINAAHLRTAQAAHNILFAIQPLDSHFPALDDGLSWPELLTRYDLKGLADDQGAFLLLTRSLVPRKFSLTPLAKTSVRFGESLALPDAGHGLVWVEIEIKKTLAGTVVNALYKPPVLRLSVKLRDHTQHSYRLVPGMAGGGFLLSPLVADNRAFAALASAGGRDLANAAVESLVIFADTASGSTGCYQDPMAIQFYRLDFPVQPSSIVWPAPPQKIKI